MTLLPSSLPKRLAECGLLDLPYAPSEKEVVKVVERVEQEFAEDEPEARTEAAQRIRQHLSENLGTLSYQVRTLVEPLVPDEESTTPLPIYSDVEVHQLPDPDWLVEDLFLQRSLVALYGPTGDGKTFVGLDISLSLGTGLQFHEREVTSGNVVYVYAEGASSLKFRVEAWKRARGWALDELANVWFVPSSVDLASEDSDGIESLLTTIEAVVPEPVALVVLDTLARCFGGADEDATQHMNRFTNRCARSRNS